jgi:hypothetical protein
MSNDNYSEEKIEQLLSQAPKLKDTRSKEEIFNRLKEDHIEILPKKQRKWAPPAVAVAALITLTVLAATFLNQTKILNESSESAMDMKTTDDNGTYDLRTQQAPKEPGMKIAGKEVETADILTIESESQVTAVYPSEISDDVTIFRIGLSGDAANSVPVTFLIPNSQIKDDFGDAAPSTMDLYQNYASQIDEEALGFSEYHPYKGTFAMDGDTIIHTLPQDHKYDLASGTITVFLRSLSETFQNYSEIVFKNEDGSTVEFDQEGEPSKPMKLYGGENHFNYFLFRQNDGKEYVTPNFGQPINSLSEALQLMKKNPNDVYSSVIPSNVNFEVIQEKETTRIKFSEPLDLEQFDKKATMQMIDGMLLTGASFGKQLQFENVVQPTWNDFDFTKPLPMPIGANEIPFILK